MTEAVLQEAVALPIIDYEDAVQVACAKAQGIDVLVTRDLKDYDDAMIKVFSPQNFLDFLNNQPHS